MVGKKKMCSKKSRNQTKNEVVKGLGAKTRCKLIQGGKKATINYKHPNRKSVFVRSHSSFWGVAQNHKNTVRSSHLLTAKSKKGSLNKNPDREDKKNSEGKKGSAGDNRVFYPSD